MNRRPEGNHELAPAELSALLTGELPLEGWRTATLHCQVDAISASDKYPDLVKLEVALPPGSTTEAAPLPCGVCQGSGVVPDPMHRGPRQTAKAVLCPECAACTATCLHALGGVLRCAEPAGHYDEERPPSYDPDGSSSDPGGWHQSAMTPMGFRMTWCDQADAATPHGAPPEPAVELRGQRLGIDCPTCGRTTVEEHPHRKGVLRCGNCKEHLCRGRVEGQPR
ncbi:hypothetical protein [Streptomyces zaomyceticus]|uniref:hypothetical protein n=1 Tax=Streptomyces zaomyceticus TaxID=68286 RepID=UPI002E1A19F2